MLARAAGQSPPTACAADRPTRLQQSLPQPGSPPTRVCYHYSAQPSIAEAGLSPASMSKPEGCTKDLILQRLANLKTSAVGRSARSETWRNVALTNGRYLSTLSTEIGMSKTQFGILNVVGGLCAVLILSNVVLTRLNSRLNQSLLERQNQLNTTQQLQTTLQSLAVRIAQAAQTESALRDLLKRHDLQVTLNVDGQTKLVP